MVDMFHEVGLVSSVPNCRTTVFTVHCVASWYIGNQVIRNSHYSRHHQVEQRIKANHKSTDAIVDNDTNGNGSLSLSLNENNEREKEGTDATTSSSVEAETVDSV